MVKGKKGGAKGKKEEKEAVPAENGETKPEGVRGLLLLYNILLTIYRKAFFCNVDLFLQSIMGNFLIWFNCHYICCQGSSEVKL